MKALLNRIRRSRKSGIAAPISSKVSVIAVHATRRRTCWAPKTDEKLKGGDFGEHWYAPSFTGDLREVSASGP